MLMDIEDDEEEDEYLKAIPTFERKEEKS